jgi:hypothetical protein
MRLLGIACVGLLACAGPVASSTQPASMAHGACSNEPDIAFVATSHAYVGRLLCPDGGFARPGQVSTTVSPNGCFGDTFALRCENPLAAKHSITFMQSGEPPTLPAGFSLLSTEALAAYNAADQAMGKDWPAAEKHIDAAIVLAPKAAVLHRTRGIIFAAQRRFAPATEAFETAVELGKRTNPLFLLELGTVYMAQARRADAARELSAALALVNPEYAQYGELQCRLSYVAEDKTAAAKAKEAACKAGFQRCCSP